MTTHLSGRDTADKEDEESTLRRLLCLPTDFFLSHFYIANRNDLSPLDLASLPSTVRHAVPKRQKEFLAGRYCAREALAQGGKITTDFLPIGSDRLPVWPPGWNGSISHTTDVAVAIVASKTVCQGLGIDVEVPIKKQTFDLIQSSVATSEEMACVREGNPLLALTIVFSAKEALFKALYPEVRRIFDFDSVRLVSCTQHRMKAKLTRDWSPAWRANDAIEVLYTVYNDRVSTVRLKSI